MLRRAGPLPTGLLGMIGAARSNNPTRARLAGFLEHRLPCATPDVVYGALCHRCEFGGFSTRTVCQPAERLWSN